MIFFLSVDNMKVWHWWASKLHFLIMAVLCLALNADNEAEMCDTGIKIQRYTVYNAAVGQQLKIACPVGVCDNSPPSITWFKHGTQGYIPVNMSNHVETKWERINDTVGISYLIFQNVLSSDSGQYNCGNKHEVSHFISVYVSGTATFNVTLQDQTNNTSTPNDDNRHMWLYLYSAAGIVGIVILVIVISVLSMRGCNGKPKKNAQCESQYMDIPLVEQPSHQSNNQASPRRSPREPPSHRPSRKTKMPSVPTQRDNVYGQIDSDTNRQRNGPEDEGSSVVYVALNHQHLAAAAPRPWMVVEERSEYAAIRVS